MTSPARIPLSLSLFLLISTTLLSVVAPAQTASAPTTRPDMATAAGELLDRTCREGEPGVAVLVARGDTVLFRAARGAADVEKGVPMKPEDMFRIGSVTKQFAAAAVLILVEAGKVSLDDPLTKYVPGYPGGDRITVLQLLNHTSGVKSYTGIPGYMQDGIRNDLTTTQLIDVFKDLPTDFEPGAGWAYNNSGYVLVGAVIEAASGKPWHVYLEEALFKPLGMTHTGYGNDPAITARQVKGYTSVDGKTAPMNTLSMTQPHAAGALVSNVDDLLKWNRALHEGRILKEKTYTAMITPVGKAADEGPRYGFGVMRTTVRGQDAIQHGGGIFGFVSSLTYVPGADVTVAVLENIDRRSPPGQTENLARRLAAMALGDPYPEAKPVPVELATLQAAEGVYRFDAETTRTLRIVDGKLTSQRSGSPQIGLMAIGVDEFLFEDGFVRLKLERDEKGRVARIRFVPDGEGSGVIGVRTDDDIVPVEVKLTSAEKARFVGVYTNGVIKLTVTLDGEALKGRIEGQDAFTLRAKSARRFVVEDAGAELEFADGAEPASNATIHQNGRRLNLPRLKD